MIPEIEKSSPQNITQFQEQKLAEQLVYLKENSVYYQQLFEKHKIDISKIKTLEDLQQIPVTEKSDLQAENDAFFCVPNEQIIDFASTSGTMGKPVSFGLTDKDLDRLAYNEAISFACAGISKNDVVQLMTTMDRKFMAGLAYFLGLRKLGAGVIRTGAGIPELQWDSILSNKPTFLITVPSFLIKMIEYAEKKGIDINKTSVKSAICIGEPLRKQDFTPSELSRRINEKWDIKLISTYASTEMSTAFTECEFQNGGHEHPELIITEVLDEDNNPVQEGEVGEITVTTLGIEAVPLLRFKTGDLARVYQEPCECGRMTKRVGPVLGRTQQMIKYKGTTVYPPAMHDVLNSFENISGHVIEVETNQIGTDDIIVKIVSKDQSIEFVENIKNHFRAKLRVTPTIEFISAQELNKIAFPPNSRKPKSVIDKR
jgi:phenylacetate-CoA ligase